MKANVLLPSKLLRCFRHFRNNNGYTVTVHNGYARDLDALVQIPLYTDTNQIVVTDSAGVEVNYQVS